MHRFYFLRSFTVAALALLATLSAALAKDQELDLSQFKLTFSDEFDGEQLATNGIDKPVLNVFRMFSRMSGDRLLVQSDAANSLDDLITTGVRGKPDVSALAARQGKRITLLAWHYHDDDFPGPDAALTLTLTGTPEGKPKLIRTLIDEGHSNSFIA